MSALEFTDTEEQATISRQHHTETSQYGLTKRPWRRYVTSWDRIINHPYPGEGTDEKPYIVDWISSSSHSDTDEKKPIDDAENPMTWSQGYKWFVVVCVAIATLAVAMASSTL